jgi:hypothetical protein
VDDAESPSLTFDLSCGLDIATDFRQLAKWDTRSVDVTLEPISTGPQVLELISPAAAVDYVDVPTNGQFATLDLPALDPLSPGAAVVTTADAHDNHAGSDAECGLFSTVYVGAGRVLRFMTPGFIYYYGAAPTIEGTIQDENGNPVPASSRIKAVISTYYGDWPTPVPDCVITNIEMAMLQQAIAGGPSRYVAYMDSNGDGVLNNVDLAKFMANYAVQPGCAGESLLGGGGELLLGGDGMDGMAAGAAAEGVDDGESVDVAALAAWLTEQLTPEDLAAFVAETSATAEERAGDAIGADMMELLSYLE